VLGRDEKLKTICELVHAPMPVALALLTLLLLPHGLPASRAAEALAPTSVRSLLLWRHAEAELASPGVGDAERELTRRGERQARRVASWLRRRAGVGADARVVASPAARTQGTARALGRAFATSAALSTASDARTLLAEAGWLPANGTEGGGITVVVGHAPTLGRAAALLLTGFETEALDLRKGGVIWLEQRAPAGFAGGTVTLRAMLDPEDIK
jgi:phosphohistidine phosphatase